MNKPKPPPKSRRPSLPPSALPSAAPPNALKVWCLNGRDILVEIPGQHGPYIESFNYDHRAIVHLFGLLGATRVDGDFASKIPESYIDSKSRSTSDVANATMDRILLQMGLIK
jgi:hypothetical protein